MELLTKAVRSPQPNQREQDNRRIAYQAACEAMVLLENDGMLPLQGRRIALYGPGASMTIKGGTGSGEVNERHSVSILEGLQSRGFEITTMDWIARFEQQYAQAQARYKQERKKKLSLLNISNIMNVLFENFRAPVGPAITQADVAKSDTDTCVYVLSRQAGEGGDRRAEPGDYYLSPEEEAAIRMCAEGYEKFLLVINCGSAIDLGFLDEIPGINALVYMCQAGMEGGSAFADLLSGAVCPSGRLADTWAKRYGDIPFANEYGCLNGNLEDEFYKEGIYVGYRYFDSFGVAPRYPFGYGLSYTTFSLHSAGVSLTGSDVVVRAVVENTGKAAGKEVVQLYVSCPEGTVQREYQSLAAFRKTAVLESGESEQLLLSFPMERLAAYREEDNCFILEKGEYILRLGTSSRDTFAIGSVYLPDEVTVSIHQPVCPQHKPMEELRAPRRQQEALAQGLPRLTMDPLMILTYRYDYAAPEPPTDERVQQFMEGLSDKDMAEIVVGAGMLGGGRFQLPGSVGNTTGKFWDKGLVNATLCDGPAGLRIQRHSTVDKRGNIKPVQMALSAYELLPEFVRKAMVGDPAKQESLYQYATAFPVAAALAQTWNTALLGQVGSAIAREMEEYGCVFWLAPAVNIHRNPLCGRNFEYFSEDPLLTGLMAAALTAAVQRQKGYYVTVKHFACNNQEDNRNHVSSNLSQRALREIYLRPFELAVKEGGAKAIMTSYNRLNGVYTPNSHDLCTKVLRCEWGFDGVVMTDWFSTNPGQAVDAACIAAGNDLVMPGTPIAKAGILAAVKSGKLSRQDLRRCCARVVRAVMDSPIQRTYKG